MWLRPTAFNKAPTAPFQSQVQCRFKTTQAKQQPAAVDWNALQIPLNFTGVKGNVAKQMLKIAHELNIVAEVRRDLKQLNLIFQDQRQKANIQTAAAIPDCPELKNKFQHPTRSLLHLLYVKRQLKDLPHIVRAFECLAVKHLNEIPIKLTVSDEEFVAPIAAQIQQALKNAGKQGNVVLTPVIDPSIIGGAIFQFETFMGDLTVSTLLTDYYAKIQAGSREWTNEAKKILDSQLQQVKRSNDHVQAKIANVGSEFKNTFSNIAEEVDEVAEAIEEVEVASEQDVLLGSEDLAEEVDGKVDVTDFTPSLLTYLALYPSTNKKPADSEPTQQ